MVLWPHRLSVKRQPCLLPGERRSNAKLYLYAHLSGDRLCEEAPSRMYIRTPRKKPVRNILSRRGLQGGPPWWILKSSSEVPVWSPGISLQVRGEQIVIVSPRIYSVCWSKWFNYNSGRTTLEGISNKSEKSVFEKNVKLRSQLLRMLEEIRKFNS